jgi:hypothetical protein
MLCLLLFFALDSATAQDNFVIFSPQYIPAQTNFQISLITSKKFADAEKLNIYISPDLSLNISKAELLVNEEVIPISINSEFVEKYSRQFKKLSIDLSDSIRFSSGSYFQIEVSLKSSQISLNSLEFYGEFLNKQKVLGYLINTNENFLSEEEYLYNLSFEYYKPYWTAGKAMSLAQDSKLNIPMNFNFDEALALEFWMKINNPTQIFLEILNKETNQVEYELSINENQMLNINSSFDDMISANPLFISKNSWYHFNLNFDKENSKLSLFCNGNELTQFNVLGRSDVEKLTLRFQNENQVGKLFLDQLRLINFKNESIDLNRNKNYSDYSDENSNVVLQINFDDAELENLLNSNTISYDGIKLVKSNAPIFPRSPEINVQFSDNFYEIEWEGGSYKDAAKYILERSIGDADFTKVGEQIAENQDDGKYSILSEKVDKTEIIYFRIKQINKDGSVVYSDVVKVGQGNIEDVIIAQNFPNPFNPTTSIEFELIQDSDVEVKVYNLAGREIAILHEGYLSKGVHQFIFDAEGFPSGVYIYQITTPVSSQTRKMILAK